MKVVLFLAADATSTDQSTNRMSIWQVLDGLAVAAVPAVFPTITVVALCRRETGDPEVLPLQIKLSCGGEDIATVASSLVFGGSPLARLAANLQGVPLPRLANLVFELLYEGAVVGTWVVEVQPAAPSLVQAVASSPATAKTATPKRKQKTTSTAPKLK